MTANADYAPEQIAQAFFESEAAMWLYVGANHPEVWLSDFAKAYSAWKEVGGMGPADRMRAAHIDSSEEA